MGTKFTLAAGLTVGVLLGSKLGPKPYETFASGMRWLRNTRVVSRPLRRLRIMRPDLCAPRVKNLRTARPHPCTAPLWGRGRNRS